MKKNRLHILGLTTPTKLATLALVIALVLSGCDFAAKNLAKQTVDAAKQMAELQEKAADVEEKVAALSPQDRRAYQEELARLGIDAPGWLFNDEAALLSGAPEETGDEGGGGILGLISGLFGGGARSADSSSSGGGRNSSVSKPSKPSSDITYRQAIAKMDEIIAYCKAHPSTRNSQVAANTQQLKEMWEGQPAIELVWPSVGGVSITSINTIIDGLE